MKKIIIATAIFIGLPFMANAQVVCPEGQISQSVIVSAGTPEVPAVTHVVHHTEVKHYVAPHFEGSWPHIHLVEGHWVIDTPAYDETIIDAPAVPAIDPVYENQCVADPNYTAPTTDQIVQTPEAPKASPHPGGRRHCGTINTPSCEVWIKNLNSQITGSVDSKKQIQSVIKQALDLLEKLVRSKINSAK
jgi:hypothetical protein